MSFYMAIAHQPSHSRLTMLMFPDKAKQKCEQTFNLYNLKKLNILANLCVESQFVSNPQDFQILTAHPD